MSAVADGFVEERPKLIRGSRRELDCSRRRKRASQSSLQLRRDGAMDENALRRHARRAVVQREAERQGFYHQIEVRIRTNNDGVAAA